MAIRDKLYTEDEAFEIANDSHRGRVLGKCGLEE